MDRQCFRFCFYACQGSAYKEHGRKWSAKDIGIKERACAWMRNGFMSVDTKSGAGRAFLRSLYLQYAEWGVDFGNLTYMVHLLFNPTRYEFQSVGLNVVVIQSIKVFC